MCDFGINPDTFNPRILYMLRRKFTENNSMSSHQHDFISLIYILSGSCTYNINNTLYIVKKGDLIVCNPGVFHGKLLTHGQEVSEFQIGFTNICVEGLPKNRLILESSYPIISFSKYDQDFSRCVNEIMSEQEKNEQGRGLMIKCLVMKLITIFFKEIHFSENPQESEPLNFETNDRTTIVSTILSFINENYMKDISLEKISKNMYLSPVYISKVFKEEIGDSPINYLIKVRLSKADEMLREGRLPVKNVAKNVGYNDAYYFSKLFKKYYGSPPSMHRTG